MIYAAKQLEGYHINARDGVLGTVKDIYFDDESWAARYFVVETGSWLKGRQVLLSAVRLVADQAAAHTLSIDATQDQVRNSPPIESQPPVSRQQEQVLHDYFGWPYYWGVAPFAGAAMAPLSPPTPAGTTPLGGPAAPSSDSAETRASSSRSAVEAGNADQHLRSVRDLRGYAIAAQDGEIGHVDDVLLEDSTWEIRHFMVDTRNWLPGRKVLITPGSIRSLDWATSDVRVDLTRDQIKQAPEYDPAQPLSATYTDRLEAHYRALRR